MRFKWIYLIFLLLVNACTEKKQDSDASLPAEASYTSEQGLELAQEKYRNFIEKQDNYDSVPRTYENENLMLKVGKDWTRGFFPGALWYLYELTGEDYWQEEAMNYTLALSDIADYTHTHDLGFMLYCSAGNGYRITGDPKLYDILIRGANSLVTRYDENIQAIKSWDWGARRGWSYPVIIDNMMNLEYLFWATKVTGDSSFYQVAVNHANTTLRNHFREDYSSYHVVDYDTTNFQPRWKGTHQGYSDQSAWTRGQAWGLYGYTVMYRETMDTIYLNQAQKIADYILNHPSLPDDLIPFYDFDDPAIPQVPRDVSAAAITASALIELDKYLPEKSYFEKATTIADALSSKDYLSENVNHPFILEHSTGSMPGDSEIDVPLVYADYYYLESIYRLKQQQNPDLLWHSNEFFKLFFQTDSILQLAESRLDQGPYSVLQKSFEPPSGDKNDYMSMGIYWWPNPNTEDSLPYLRKDGQVNPEVRKITDKTYLSNTIENALLEGMAYYYSGNKRYSQKATSLLKSWFINDSTRMNPHLQYGQGVPGRSEGRCYGIIETRDISQALDAAHLIVASEAWQQTDQNQLNKWMRDYLHWLRTSELGQKESQTLNNHRTWYQVQTASIALGVGDHQQARTILLGSSDNIKRHIDATGLQPEEVARTRSWNYSVMNLAGMMLAARLADQVGLDLWHVPHGQTPAIQQAVDFLIPFAINQEKWPYQQITTFKPEALISILQVASLQYPEKEQQYQQAMDQLAKNNRPFMGFYNY